MLLTFLILGLVFLSICGFIFFLLDSALGKLDFTTGRLAANNVVKILKDHSLQNGNFYDLGSCRGGFAIKMAKALPTFDIIGIDDSGLRTLLAKIHSLFLKNIKFKTGNIFTQDVSSANIVYLYLPQELMPELEIKLQKELKPGALAISASVSFPNWQPTQVYDLDQKGLKVPKLFVYKQI